MMAPRWKWHRPASASPGSSRAVGGGEDTRRVVSFHLDLDGFWVLDLAWIARRPIRSSRKTSQIPPCTSCLRKKAARPLARHPLDAGPLAALDLHSRFLSPSGQEHQVEEWAWDSKRTGNHSTADTPNDHSTWNCPLLPALHAKQRTRAQEWLKMMSTWTPDTSCGFLISRHLKNINSSNPNALNTAASAGLHKLH